jgi:FixJ family two-component response regulator
MSEIAAQPRRPVVVVVDDDESVRESSRALLSSFALKVHTFSSAEALLGSALLDAAECLILDVLMPGMTGPELYRELKQRGCRVPVVFITAHGDESMRPQMLEMGAIDYLLKPFREAELIDAVRRALTAGKVN